MLVISSIPKHDYEVFHPEVCELFLTPALQITLLEQELKIQSVFISIDSNGVFYTHASSKCKELIDESSELYRMFASG